MRHSIRKLFLLLATVLSLTAVQAVCADEISVTGTIVRIGTGETGSIDVVTSNEELYIFYHIPFINLETANIYLNMGDLVTISAYVVTFPNGSVKNIAYGITVDDVTYTWHLNVPKVGMTDFYSATAAADCTCNNCYCACPEDCQDCSCECSCDCTCDGTGPNGPKN